MQVITHDRLRNPRRIKATRVVIEDDFGNPVGAFLQVEPGHIVAEIADDEQKFNSFLRQLGINKTIVIDEIKPQPPPA